MRRAPGSWVHMGAMQQNPLLVTIPNVELFEVGENWMASTGEHTFTFEDVAEAVAAQYCPHLVAPVLKFGHTDDRFTKDGEFAVGRITNLHSSENGTKCLGDYTGVPLWLARIMPTAYPRRSIEGEWGNMTRAGQINYDGFYLSGLALLGACLPAIQSLEDLELFWIDGTPPMYDVETGEIMPFDVALEHMGIEDDVVMASGEVKPRKVAAAKTVGSPRAHNVSAATQAEDVIRTFYDEVADKEYGYWSWIRALYVDPLELIVDDGDGNLFLVKYSIDGDEITFEDGEAVKVQYVPVAASGAVAAAAVTARASQEAVVVHDGPPDGRVRAASEDQQVPEAQEGDVKLSEKALKALGLTAEATEDEVNAALEAQATEDTSVPAPVVEQVPAPVAEITEATEVTIPEGMQLVDAAAWTESQRILTHLATKDQENETTRRTDIIKAAVRAGKITKASMPEYEKRFEVDPAGTEVLLTKTLTPVIPVEQRELAVEDDPQNGVAATTYPSWMKRGEVAAAAAEAPAVRPAHVQQHGGVTVITA